MKLVDKEQKKKKVATRKWIKTSRKTLTIEVNSWTKLVQKYEAKERPTMVERSYLKSAIEFSKEVI